MATNVTPPVRKERSYQSSEHSSDHGRREQRRSANRVKAKPANPLVINSILDSLDTLSLAPTTPPDTHSWAESISERSRPESTDSLRRSLSVQAVKDDIPPEFVAGPRLDAFVEEDESEDAALPPVVRTSRPPSGLTQYSALRTPSFTGTCSSTVARTPSIRSRRSSYSSLNVPKERPSYSRNKLSAESWVKRNSVVGNDVESGNKGHGPKDVRRMESEESLDSRGVRVEHVPDSSHAVQSRVTTASEQIIAKATTTPLSPSKRRLYLTDSGSTEEHSDSLSAQFGEPSPPDDQLYVPASKSALEDTSPGRLSLRRTMIVDSIPTRTSSLRHPQSGSPVRGKKKDRKSRRMADWSESANSKSGAETTAAISGIEQPDESKVDSVIGSSSKVISESSWADLGEEDETVRRIRELQEQRKSRHLEVQKATLPDLSGIGSAGKNASLAPLATVERHTARDVTRIKSSAEPKTRPGSSRALTEPATKAHKILGIQGHPDIHHKHDRSVSGSVDASPLQRRHTSIEPRISEMATLAAVPTLPTPPLSLDYSYADAVDALRNAEREPPSTVTTQQSHKLSASISEELPSITAKYPGTKVNLVPVAAPSSQNTPVQSLKSLRRKQQNRWTHHHPDLPLELERGRNRRKSTSDARNTRYIDLDTDVSLPRRDSIEVAVNEYLHHGRLNRRIKHPRTGRIISFSEVGDRNGAAVFVCVGMGLTRYVTAFYDELATTLRLRLITIDRPGVGGSEPFPTTERGSPLTWPDDVLAICQYLDISKFSMVAHSAGAIYALATALVLPHLVEGKIHLLAPWIPPSQLEAVSHSTASSAPAGALPRSQRILRVLPTTFLKAANSSFMTATSASLKPATRRSKSGTQVIVSPPVQTRDRPATRDGAPTSPSEINRRESLMLMDQFMPELTQMDSSANGSELGTSADTQSSLVMSATATPMDPSLDFASMALNAAEHTERERKNEYTARLTQRTWELAVRDSNPATDLLVCLERHGNVGFRYTDVSREIIITHGSEDKRVPLANVKWLAEQMNRRVVAADMIDRHQGIEGSQPRSRPCELRVLGGEGHGLMASPTIMSNVLTEIAGYWRMK